MDTERTAFGETIMCHGVLLAHNYVDKHVHVQKGCIIGYQQKVVCVQKMD